MAIIPNPLIFSELLNMKIWTHFILICLFLSGFSYLSAQSEKQEFAIVIHGGAGNISKENITPEQEAAYYEGLLEARDLGYEMLEKGESALDVVEAVLKSLENNPNFNAGKGAVFTNAGTNELDASIMDGKTLDAGAVAGVRTVKNPISAARMVLEQSKHVMLSGYGAEAFAKEQGLETVENSYFKVDKRWEQLMKIKEQEKQQNDKGSLEEAYPDWKFGTVGCTVLDKKGNLAAGTSTGGMTNKRWGRIGDSPIIGAGTYANNATCAISCTGHGEFFIRYAVAHDISAMMEYKGVSLREAARVVILGKLKEAGGSGGIIGVDRNANIVSSFNTAGMFRAARTSKGVKMIGMYASDNDLQGEY